MNNMTALVSCFARAYHFENNDIHIFADNVAKKLLGETDHRTIAASLTNGIEFFSPAFQGDKNTALRHITEQHLAPTVLARSAFCESALNNALKTGCRQYLIFAAGYDTFAFRNTMPDLKIFELDRAGILTDKIKRAEKANLTSLSEHKYIPCDLSDDGWMTTLTQSGFNKNRSSFGSPLGLSYYLSAADFSCLLENISSIYSIGSSLVFDYPTISRESNSDKIKQLAAAANESMKSEYSYFEIEKLLESHGFLIYEHLNAEQINARFFSKYNSRSKYAPINAPQSIGCCLAVKKG